MQINLAAKARAKPERVTFTLLAQLLTKYLDGNTLDDSTDLLLFSFFILRQFYPFLSVCCSVDKKGEDVPRSGSWNFPSSVVLLLLSSFSLFFFFCCRSEHIYNEVVGEGSAVLYCSICPG